jgi:hypothetical protein
VRFVSHTPDMLHCTIEFVGGTQPLLHDSRD